MQKFLLCGTEKIRGILLESALTMVLEYEYLATELVKLSIKQITNYKPAITVKN